MNTLNPTESQYAKLAGEAAQIAIDRLNVSATYVWQTRDSETKGDQERDDIGLASEIVLDAAILDAAGRFADAPALREAFRLARLAEEDADLANSLDANTRALYEAREATQTAGDTPIWGRVSRLAFWLIYSIGQESDSAARMVAAS